MRYLAILLLAGLGLAACDNREAETEDTARQNQAPDIPRYSARAFYETVDFAMARGDGHAFSPDGAQLLVSSDETGVMNAYALDLADGSRTPLTESVGDATYGISWFPNDGRILVTRDQGGNELNHVLVREPEGGFTDLTPGDNLKAGFLGWAADGLHVYLTSNERDPRHFDVYRYAVDGYEREMAFENTGGYRPAAISPDARWLALDKPVSSADSDIYIVDLAADDPEPELVTPHEGNVSHAVMTFTPDSNTLVYGTNAQGEFRQAISYDLASGEVTPLIAAEWDVMYVGYSVNGRYRVSAINADAQTRITVLDTDSGETLDLPGLPEGDLGSVRFTPDAGKMALLLERDTAPGNVYMLDLPDGAPRKLTDALNPDIDESHLVEGDVVRFASYDGLQIPGILYRPHQATEASPAPALVWVHGGPGGQSRKGYRATIQHLVNHGYAVYAINNRGSSGYGKTFYHLDDKKHGEADLGDVVASRDFLAGMSWIDGGKIGIIGGSYGGYMVAAALAFEPEVFDVGIDIFGVTNWVRTLKSIPPWWEAQKQALFDELGDPATDEERLRRISPLFHAGNIIKPLLVVQGANDPRVLQVESDELVEQVRANGVPVEYIVFDDEGHGFRKRANRIAASEAYVRFLDTYLKGGQQSAS